MIKKYDIPLIEWKHGLIRVTILTCAGTVCVCCIHQMSGTTVALLWGKGKVHSSSSNWSIWICAISRGGADPSTPEQPRVSDCCLGIRTQPHLLFPIPGTPPPTPKCLSPTSLSPAHALAEIGQWNEPASGAHVSRKGYCNSLWWPPLLYKCCSPALWHICNTWTSASDFHQPKWTVWILRPAAQ